MKKVYKKPEFQILRMDQANVQFYAASPVTFRFVTPTDAPTQYADPTDNSDSDPGSASMYGRDDENNTIIFLFSSLGHPKILLTLSTDYLA